MKTWSNVDLMKNLAKRYVRIISWGRKHIKHETLQVKVYEAPLGRLVIWNIGNMAKGLYPSVKDMEDLKCQMDKLTKAEVGGFGLPGDTDPFIPSEHVFFPPILECQMSHGNAVFYLGDVEKGIMPDKRDLKAIRELLTPMLKRLGVKRMVFLPAGSKVGSKAAGV